MTVDPMLLDLFWWAVMIAAVGVVGWIIVTVKDEYDDNHDDPMDWWKK